MSNQKHVDYYLNPGSPEALNVGCECPVLSNGHGIGAYGGAISEPDSPWKKAFWINGDCPIHGKPRQTPTDSGK